jgi:AcrR family transcriptional regulator
VLKAMHGKAAAQRMPRNIERDLELRKERCEQIISAAVELFAKNGLADTKISDIAAKANMSHGLVYNYFHSKEEIYISILEKNLCSLKMLLDTVISLPVDAYGKLAALAEQFQSGQWNDAIFHQIFIDQFFNSDSISQELKNSVKTKLEESINTIASIIEEGQADGVLIDENPQELAFLFLSLAHSIIIANTRGLTFFKQPFGKQILRLFLLRNG